jgi:hypothetical protein
MLLTGTRGIYSKNAIPDETIIATKNSLVFAMVQLAELSEGHKNIDHDSHHDEVVLLPKIIDFTLNLSVYLS